MSRAVKVELSAVILALDVGGRAAVPVVLTPEGDAGRDLPTAAFDPDRHRTLQTALRDWVAETTGLDLGYVEQLYTFGDPIRSAGPPGQAAHTVSIGYLALVGPEAAAGPDWTRWDRWFPWEDRRHGAPPVVAEAILPRLDAFAPELIVVSAGFDAHRADPLASLELGIDDFAWITSRICDLADAHAGGRVVSTLEGGYDLSALAASAAAHVDVLMERGE